LADIATDCAASHPEAVGTLVAAATDILLKDVGPEGAIITLESLAASTRAIFGKKETVQ
jgi:hypothetical protein